MFNTDIKEIIDAIDENCFITSDDHFGHKSIFDFQPHRKYLIFEDGYSIEGLWPNDLLTTHDDWLVKRFNSAVSENDTTLFLGDFAFKGLNIVKRLNGKKILILGNHDRKGDHVYKQAGFDYVIRGLVVAENNKVFQAISTDGLFSALVKNINGFRFLFNHYPPDEREYRHRKDDDGNLILTDPSQMNARIDEAIDAYNYYNCDFAIHGHTHNKCPVLENVNLINICRDNNDCLPFKIGDIINGVHYD